MNIGDALGLPEFLMGIQPTLPAILAFIVIAAGLMTLGVIWTTFFEKPSGRYSSYAGPR